MQSFSLTIPHTQWSPQKYPSNSTDQSWHLNNTSISSYQPTCKQTTAATLNNDPSPTKRQVPSNISILDGSKRSGIIVHPYPCGKTCTPSYKAAVRYPMDTMILITVCQASHSTLSDVPTTTCSRGHIEPPAAWRDPVAFGNGTRPIVLRSLPCARNKVLHDLRHYPPDSNKRVSNHLHNRRANAESGSVAGLVLAENPPACGVACSSSVWKSARWPVQRPPARIPGS